MSTLNSRLQLSILNRKKSKNLVEKGFTLIELLITVVILGALSSIALPAFLNQQDKAKVAAANADVMGAARSCAALKITDEEALWVKPAKLLTGACPATTPAGGQTFVSATVTGITAATATLNVNGAVVLTTSAAAG